MKLSLITDQPLSLDQAIAQVKNTRYGAVLTFSGCIRNTENHLKIDAIVYEAYVEMAEKEIRKIIQQAETQWDVAVSIQHRIGRVPVGEPSLVVACAGVHRPESFRACQFVVNQVKSSVPIWKVSFEKSLMTASWPAFLVFETNNSPKNRD
jgi:molybdopterin synthase catalytic subunit